MKRPRSPSHVRERELLLEQALGGLDDAERAELEGLRAGEERPDESFDVAAAAVVLASAPATEALPDALAEKILAAATTAPRRDASAEARVVRRASPPSARPVWLAAAAGLLLAAAGWGWGLSQRGKIQTVFIPSAPSAAPAPAKAVLSPAEERAAFLREAKDVAKVEWQATKDPAARGAAGDAAWSPSAQSGYLRFSGLAPNDRTKSQYQLWIFDRDRDARYPVDGGVFDVDSNGEVVVRVAARLHVAAPTLFAVTVEKPGGVVVSARERIVLTATFKPG